ncbi:hypothetical protein SESBI_24347 [Sesbania bispinosa]|nr:hypothetical protein SESBI_24347 [Sesbania bispinosa]
MTKVALTDRSTEEWHGHASRGGLPTATRGGDEDGFKIPVAGHLDDGTGGSARWRGRIYGGGSWRDVELGLGFLV